jgi:hypothetical protein
MIHRVPVNWTATWTNPDPLLQGDHGTVSFRNIRLKELRE